MVMLEDIRSVNLFNIPFILGRTSLYNFSYLYNYYKEVLDLSTKIAKSVYDRGIVTSRELEEYGFL